MKRIFSMILALALVIACLPVFPLEVHAVTVDSGTCGANLTWTLDDAGTLTISGTGDMYVYSERSTPWAARLGFIKSGVIENGVTSIGDYTFYHCKNLTSVTIPDSVTRIGWYAFAGCSSLTSVTIPDSVTHIGTHAFAGCSSLTSVTIPDSVTTIDPDAFQSCTRLTSVTIPDSVTSIGDGAFCNCSNLTSVTIPDSVTVINYKVFSGCSSLTSVSIPDSVTRIDTHAFAGCSSLTSVTIGNSVTSIGELAFSSCTGLTSVTIPDSVTSIGGNAFRDCSSLTSVTIPDSVTTIGERAFCNCSNLTSVTIPDSVTTIGERAFSGCTSLAEINVDKGNPNYSSDSYGVFDKAKKTLVICPGGKTGEYIIPDSVTSIDVGAFAGCSSLTSVTIPDSVTSISDFTFSDCSSLTSVTIPNSVTSIGFSAFSRCVSLTSVTIPDSVTNISDYAFNKCINLTSVTIGNSVNSIFNLAFEGCTNLREITFTGNAPRYCSTDAFKNVTATVYYPADDTTWTADKRKNYGGTLTWVPYGDDSSDPNSGKCGDNVYWKYEDRTLTISGTGAMYDYTTAVEPKPWYGLDITYVVIEDGVTHVGAYAFYDTDMFYVTIGDTVTSIGEWTFANNYGLWQVTIGNSVETIGDGAFAACLSLSDIVIPDSVKVIGISAFAECDLENVTIGDTVTSIGKWAFENCSFSEIVIPASVTSIGDEAFADNEHMQKITFEGDAPSFGTDVFGGIYEVEAEAYYPGNNTTWTASKRQQYGGKITWIPYGSEEFDNIMGTGTCGANLTWTLTKDGVLTISGTGKMYDYSFDSSPWYNYRNSVKTVVIEDEVTSIGDCAFCYCTNLSSITIGESVTSIGEWAFDQCESLSEVVIGDRVTSIGGGAFSACRGLSKMTMGASVARIDGGAFNSVGNFGEIIFTGNAPSFASEAFDFAVGTIYYPADNPTWTADIMQDYGNGPITWIPYQTGPAIVASGKCGANLTWKLTEDGVLTISGTGDMDNYTDNTMPWYDYKNSVKSVVIENGVTSIGDCAFKDFGSLTDVAIGETVTGIGDYAFDCCHLASLTIPNSVTSIGIYAFRHCKRLTSLNFPNSVTSIGAYAFCYCTGLTEVTFGKSVTFIDDGAFYECTNLNKITFKGSAPTIGSSIMAGLTFSGMRATAYYYPDETWTEDVMQVCGSLITWVAMEMPKLSLGGEEFADQDTVWIEGLPYPIQGEGNDRYVELPTEDDCYMVTYTYHTGDAADVHTQYPTGMKVYKVSDGEITHIPELDNLLQYSGASIRITGKKGIRMITSLTKANKTALTGKGLAGFKLLEYGTALCFAHEIPQGDALVLGRDFTRSNYAYKKGVADPVFASTKDLIQYTNVLVGFSLDQCKDDIAMRPYIILEDAAGNQITLYGGTIYRSIGYIAYQNRTVFTPKTASYNYVWEIIHHVYGDKYDADYKG